MEKEEVMNTKSRLFGTVLCLFTLAGLAVAQETRASLTGFVTDATGGGAGGDHAANQR